MYPIEPAVPVPVVALYVFALKVINWLTPSVRPESTLLLKLTPVVRTFEPTERTLDVILSKVAARSPKMFVVVVADPILTIFALADAFWMFRVAVRAALVKRLAMPPVFAVNKSQAVPNEAVCSEFTLLVKAVNVAAMVVLTPTFPMAIDEAFTVPTFSATAVSASKAGDVIPSVNLFVPVHVLLLESKVVPAFNVDWLNE
jgi:hypothetical protein